MTLAGCAEARAGEGSMAGLPSITITDERETGVGSQQDRVQDPLTCGQNSQGVELQGTVCRDSMRILAKARVSQA